MRSAPKTIFSWGGGVEIMIFSQKLVIKKILGFKKNMGFQKKYGVFEPKKSMGFLSIGLQNPKSHTAQN